MPEQRNTTAHLAAEILGDAGVRRAIPALRDAVESHDYMVSAKSMLALAKLRDTDSIGRIEAILERSPNPRITIYAAKALEAFESLASLPLIFRRIDRRAELFVRDELILVASSLLGIYTRFYPVYIEFLTDPAEGIRTLGDLAATASEPVRDAVGKLAVQPGGADRAEFVGRAIAVFETHSFTVSGVDVSPWFVDALRNRSVGRLDRFCVLVAAVMPATTSYTAGYE